MGKDKKYKDKKDGNVALRVEDKQKGDKIESQEIIPICEGCNKDLSPEEEFVFMCVPSENYVVGKPDKNFKIMPATFICNECFAKTQ